ncbi:D-alanyl-D-alanine carboxypeptidase [Priestia filamentosa]|uniref:D-alanyl-D-alanine carboxypeptidase family protein n=1 Tax=Priestia filamentosa TaxID=1402861 RepID=UPI00204C9BD2|nr:D-alanyl-D-alanine carboxypeptidase [Priestia filamentosa]
MKGYKKILCYMIVTIFLAGTFPLKSQAQGEVSARSAILIDQRSGRILYEKDIHEKRRIASITKIMTAILAVESGEMNKKVKVSRDAIQTEGSAIYLEENEKILLEDLVYGLMLRSGNDAAEAIAEHVGGSKEGFVYLMNQKAAEIGMENTEFANPHGLDDHENHYSTAYDMAILMKYAMNSKKFREISGTKTYRTKSGAHVRVFKNKNKLLTSLYPHTTGGKTGYTKRAKRTLVSSAQKDGLDLIAVTINAPSDWDDHIYMYNMGFDNYKATKVVQEGEIEGVKNKFYEDKLYVKRDFIYPLTEKEQEKVKTKLTLLKPRKKEWKDERNVPQIVGKISISLDGKALGEMPIYYDHGGKETGSFFEKAKELFFIGQGVR